MNPRDHTQGLHPTRLDIPPEIRRYVIQLLNQTLACTVDLRSHVKQAGWNGRDPDFAASSPCKVSALPWDIRQPYQQLDKQQRAGVVWDQREIFWRLIRE